MLEDVIEAARHRGLPPTRHPPALLQRRTLRRTGLLVPMGHVGSGVVEPEARSSFSVSIL